MRDAVEKLVTSAGGVYSGRISLTEKFVEAGQASLVDGLATTLAPPGTAFPDGASPYDKAAAMLASAVVTNDRGQAGRPNVAAAGVLEAFQSGDFLTLSGKPEERATMAIVLAPAQPYDGEDAERETNAVVSVAAGLDSGALGTVLAGTANASGTGGVIEALHDTGGVASAVSTVDTLDFAAGRVVVVYALREQLAGRSGAYGIGSGATAFEPSVAPHSPSPTPTPAGSRG